MESSAYKRKTTNPKMGWSDERREEFSAKMKKAHADGTWNKKSKKAIGKAISEGRKRWVKFNNRSEAMKKSWKKRKANFFSPDNINKRLVQRAASPVIEPKSKVLDEVLAGVAEVASKVEEGERFSFPEPYESWSEEQKREFAEMISLVSHFLDQVELAFGGRPSLHTLLMTAVDEKLKKIFSQLGSYRSSEKEGK